MMKSISTQILFLFLSLVYLNAQSTGDAVILLQGKVLDKSGRPVGTNIYFDNQNGKKINTKSNSIDGVYQQILTPGKTYTVYFKDYIETSGEIEIDMPAVSKYTELSRTFTVDKIREGMELMRFNAFKSNSTELSGNHEMYFSNLKNFMSTNLNAGIVLTIHMHDCSFKSKTNKEEYKDKKNKTKYRKVTITVAQQAEAFAQSRIEELKNYFQNIKFPEKRITWVIDSKTGGAKSAAKSKTKGKKDKSSEEKYSFPNVTATVGQIKKL